MKLLSNELLIDTYLQAIHYQCDREFIQMLAFELQLRGIILPEQQYSA
ncbi:MAG: sporulation histidine kinase inhibitor Sda [Candidatus Pristimantibacillus lignocellulolyticus]|uniref:Sporulation histidine kinase inhibitor Sda n=1 Tax=Candidatus Pristimantibacillus lignocellulolyticus TaxID=2994561 RepID=A0A9J6ZFY4_9BACL|nr:MAG: sporulation histidine kinase inhibitor Sda [Candidatus Pristimantibacillus lignocellulolyticus]